MNIKYRDHLLQNLLDGLKDHKKQSVTNLEVVFHGCMVDGEFNKNYPMDFIVALDWLLNDTYYDETSDIRDAHRLTVRTY